MNLFTRFVIAFLALTGAVVLASGILGLEFGTANYWDHHGFLFLFFLATFPRLTLLLSDVASGGLLWWVGWLFAPRLLVALLATVAYWRQNPILVAAAWIVALGGESSEKVVMVRQTGLAGGARRVKHVRAKVQR